MIERIIVRSLLGLLLLNGAVIGAESAAPPLASGFARLVVERADEPLFTRQDALITLNGRFVGRLAKGARLQLDLAPGPWRVAVRTRSTAEASLLPVTLKPNQTSRVRVELDPVRFPPQRHPGGLLDLLGESLSAPHDDRQPLFVLRELHIEVPEGEQPP